ncbi:MAG: cytochrome c oxidase assembly protein [Pseudomonadota bacterium]
MMANKTKIALIAGFAPLAMFGMAFAGVPLYKLFCEKTGYNGTTSIAKDAASEVLSRQIKIRFDANIMPNVPWRFTPEQSEVSLRLGENGLAFYRVTNTSDHPITAVANYNVTPHKAAIYFQKLECFCFKNQTLAAGETREMPVIFYVDPRLASDEKTKEISQVTLSYTFFEVPKQTVELQTGPS